MKQILEVVIRNGDGEPIAFASIMARSESDAQLSVPWYPNDDPGRTAAGTATVSLRKLT